MDGSADDSSESPDYSEKWEIFMLLWSATPEVFIGSCLLSIFAIIGTIILSKFINCDSASDSAMQMSMEDDFVQNDTLGISSKARILKTPNSVKQKNSVTNTAAVGDATTNKLYRSKYVKVAEKMKANLTQKELTEERLAQKEQLKVIFDLMKSKSEMFGMTDVTDVEEQMRLYM